MSVCRTSFRRTGDHPENVSPASRRPFSRASIRQAGDFPFGRLPASRRPSRWISFRQAGDCPSCGSSPPGEPGFPTIRFYPGEPFKSRPVVPSSKLSGRPFAIPLPEGSGFAGLRKSGFGLRFPRCLALLSGCPTRASLASFPKDIGPLGTGGVLNFRTVSGRSFVTAKGQYGQAARFAKGLRACG